MTRRQARDLARRLARLERKQRSTAAAHADLRHSSVDGGVFKIKDADGNTAYELGTDPATGITAPQFKGGPKPEQPEAPFVDAGQRVIKVQHSGLDINEEPAPADFKVAEVHVSQDQDFEPSLSTLGNHIAVPNGSVDHSLPAGEWYVGIVWVTLSGQRSPMSEPVLAVIEPPVDVQDIQDTLDAAESMLDEYAAEVAAPRFQALEEGLETHEVNIADARTRLETAETELVEALEGPIDHERLRVGEGAFDEAFASKLIADHATIINAAMRSLSVEERLDFATAFGQEIWSALGVFDRLQAEQAWIGGTMLEDDTITTRNIVFTEDLVGNIAQLLHLVVDRIDANSLWADQTWQAAGHFGSSSADQSTRVDGTGLRITKHDHQNETSTDIVRLGGEGIGLTFFDEETGEVTGSQSPEGDASYRDVSVDRLTIGGRLLLPETDPAEFWDGNLWDSQPKGLVCFHEVDMRGVSVNHTEYGFIEVSHYVYANRKYRVTTNNFLVSNDQSYYGRFRYTIGDNPDAPHTESAQLGNTWLISQQSNIQIRGDHTFTPPQDGLIRILLCVSRTGSTPGITFNNNASYATAQLRLEDLGPSRPYTGMARNAGHGGAGTVRDPRPLVGGITTAWDMTWFQNYSHGGTQRRSSSSNRNGYGGKGPTQGQRQDSGRVEGIWRSVFGHTTSTQSTNTNDLGVSVPAALNGADLLTAYLELTVGGTHNPRNFFNINVEVRPADTYPTSYTSLTSDGYLLDSFRGVRVGQTVRIPLPLNQLETALRNGEAQSFGLWTQSTAAHWSGWLSWDNRPRLVLTYQR